VDDVDWIKVATPKDNRLILDLFDKLDMGESEAIALAMEMEADLLIIDEFMGRKIAYEMGIRITGVLGVLIKAKQEGYIINVKSELENLERIGFRLDSSLKKEILEELREL